MKKYNLLTGKYEEVDEKKSKLDLLTGYMSNPVESTQQLGKSSPVNPGQLGSLLTTPNVEIPEDNKDNILNLLSIGNYASTKFVDTLASDGNIVKAFGDAFVEAGRTAVSAYRGTFKGTSLNNPDSFFADIENPEMQTYSQLIQKHIPEFAKEYPVTTSLLGFVGDIALDPTTYISFGSNNVIKLGGKKLSNKGIDLARELNTLAQDGFRATVEKGGLNHLVDFGPDEVRRLNLLKEQSNGWNLIGQEVDNIIQAKVPNSQLIDLRALTGAERNVTVEQSFLNAARLDDKLFRSGTGDLGLFINIPFSPKNITLISENVIDIGLEKLGLKRFNDAVKDSLKATPIEAVAKNFQRDYGLDQFPLYTQVRSTLHGELNRIDHSLLKSAQDIFDLPLESRNKLRELASDIDARIQTKVSGLQPGQKVTDKAVNMTRQWHLNRALNDGKINTDEFNAFTKFVSAHNQLADLEKSAQLYKQTVTNHNPNIYFFSEHSLGKDSYAKLQLSIAKGFVPDQDLSLLFALRMKNTLYNRAYKNFDDSLEMLFGQTTIKKGKQVIKTKGSIPQIVQKDVDFIGHSIYSDRGQNSISDLRKLYKEGLSIWKTGAYAIKPSAGPRQYIGNTLQAFTKIGSSAFKSLDPRSLLDGMLMMADQSSFRNILPRRLIESYMQHAATLPDKMVYGINRYSPDFVKDITVIGRLGEKIEGKQLFDELIDNDIFHKGLNIMDLDTARDLKLEIAKQNGFSAFQKAKYEAGFMKFASESLPWINLPGQVENINRTATYINARRMGYLPEQAKKLTNEALFDYAQGLSKFEKQTMRDIVPFYTFQRFAIPLIGSLIKEPGKATTLVKITKEFFEVYNLVSSGEQLTDGQRAVLPGYLLEQPNVFEGMTQDGQIQKGIFRTFNNYTFTDMLNLVQLNVEGNIDWQKTILKMTAAQLAPIIKVPMELLWDKNFFTNQVISKGGKISSGEKIELFENNVPDFMKSLMSYEIRVDPATQEKKGYINPYITYMMTAFVPAISDYVSITRDDLDGRDFAMKYFLGVGKVKLNFETEKHWRMKEWQDTVKELQKNLRQAILVGNEKVISEDQVKLQQTLQRIGKLNSAQVQ